MRRWGIGLWAVWFFGCAPTPPETLLRVDWSTLAARTLRARLQGPEATPRLQLKGRSLTTLPEVPRFYRQRQNRLAWCGPHGPLRQADALLQVLRQVAEDGLRLEDYHLSELQGRISSWRSLRPDATGPAIQALVELDLLLTDAFLRCAAHLQRGQVDPRAIYPEWRAAVPRTDLAGLLQTALDLNQVEETLVRLRPSHPQYERLRQALAGYRQLASQENGLPLPERGTLTPGSRGLAVQALCHRLAATGDLGAEEATKDRFDREVEQALRRFQRRHGLPASGRVDPATREILEAPLEKWIAQLELNLERWRWLPRGAEARYLLVQLNNFELEAIEKDEIVLQMRVVVGKPQWRTPICSGELTYLEFNPYWYIPRSIALEEVLPEVRQDSSYLSRKGIRVARGKGDAARVVAADSIDWQGISEEEFDYLFFQPPGPENPLGRVKFFFPNSFDVYLHDTPEIHLFAHSVREFSHGCIRLEKSMELAEYLLKGKWDRTQIEAAVASGENQVVPLPMPIPIYLIYWTAWVDDKGRIQFRQDPYASDQRLEAELAKPQG